MWPWNLIDDREKLYGTSCSLHQALCIISNPSVNSNCSCCPETLNSGQNRRLFAPCDLEIQWMTLKNNRDPLLCYIKLCASFQSHQWIQTKVTVRKRSIRAKMGDFFVPCDLQIWWMTLKNNRASLLCCFKLYVSFHNHRWIQTKVIARKRSIRVKIDVFCVPYDLEIWRMNLKNNRAPLLCYF